MVVIKSNMYVLAIIGLTTTVISAFYYLRIIKIIYFDNPKISFDQSKNLSIKIPLLLSCVLVLLYFIYPTVLIDLVSYINIS